LKAVPDFFALYRGSVPKKWQLMAALWQSIADLFPNLFQFFKNIVIKNMVLH